MVFQTGVRCSAVQFRERSGSTNTPCWKTRGQIKCWSCLNLSMILVEDMMQKLPKETLALCTYEGVCGSLGVAPFIPNLGVRWR